MAETFSVLREEVMHLIQQRDALDAEIIGLHAELKKHKVGMSDPLIDSEGYPRNDLDIYAIRSLRQQIICKTNDCKALNKEIEEGMHRYYAENTSESPTFSHSKEKTIHLSPFAKVDEVFADSPAEKADLRVGDLIIKFDKIVAHNYNSRAMVEVVESRFQQPLRINVLRNEKVVPLILIPQHWEGGGYLGCKILPIF